MFVGWVGQLLGFCFLVVDEEGCCLLHHLLRLKAEAPVLASVTAAYCLLVVAGCTS